MKILFLTVSDQQNHPMHRHVDLHCSFDFKAWEKGFGAIAPDVLAFDYYANFVATGPLGMERQIRELVRKHTIQLLIVPNMYYELAPTFLEELRNMGCRSVIVFFDDSLRFDQTNRFYLGAFDYYLTQESANSQAMYKPFGIEAEFFPVLPSYSFYHETIRGLPETSRECRRDVVFVGAKIADRQTFITYLGDHCVDVAVFGK